ncbi:MAG: hypothetical protein KGH49_01610 [Candidatus Micrarchaeota archaeon]|nr:hypothetical protein [Candidatus Micrarchaeota archaeon]
MIRNIINFTRGKYNELVGKVIEKPYIIKNKTSQQFIFNGAKYDYCYHDYGTSWRNERTVEIPLAQKALSKYLSAQQSVLEVGNVLQHYSIPRKYTIVDKYEKAPGVINEDIIDFSPSEKFDYIFSISTLEHPGFDEKEKDPRKPLRVLKSLIKNLEKGGELFATVPIGYNPAGVESMMLKDPLIQNTQFMKRINGANEWQQVGGAEALQCNYNRPFNNANAIAVINYKN